MQPGTASGNMACTHQPMLQGQDDKHCLKCQAGVTWHCSRQQVPGAAPLAAVYCMALKQCLRSEGAACLLLRHRSWEPSNAYASGYPHLGSCLASLLESVPGVYNALLQFHHLFLHLLQLEGVLLQLCFLGIQLHLQDGKFNCESWLDFSSHESVGGQGYAA